MATVGIIMNPRAGKDRWRASFAASTTEAARVSQLRSLVDGAAETGAQRILLNRDPQGLTRRAVGGMQSNARVELLDTGRDFSGADSARAAEKMREKGADVLVVVGGDGTVRDVCRGWRDAPMIAFATGSTATFAERVDPSIVGMAAGLVARHEQLPAELISHRAQTIHVDIDDNPSDLAVVTVAVLKGEPATSHTNDFIAQAETILNAIAEPWNIGLSSIAGLVAPTARTDDRAVLIEIDPRADRLVRAPITPGDFHDVRLSSISVVAPEQRVHVKGPAALALDSDVLYQLAPGQHVALSVHRDGPRVIDIQRVFAQAVRDGYFVSSPLIKAAP